MIEAKSLGKSYTRYRHFAVKDLSFVIDEGEIVGLAGPNGAGKTTTLKMLSGVTLPTSGSVSIDGFDVVNEKENACGKLGYVPDVPVFEADSSIMSIMLYFAELTGFDKAVRKGIVEDLLKEVGLSGIEYKRAQHLSLGMKKRLSFAIGLMGNPRNVLLDELFNGLDPAGLSYIKERLFRIRKEGGSVLISSHVLNELQNITDRVLIINKGRFVESVRPSELFEKGFSNVRVTIENPDQRLIYYLKQYGETEISGNTIRIARAQGDVKALNTELVKMGYVVSEFSISENVLEDYFREKTRTG